MTQTLKIQTARVFKPLLAPARYKGAHGGRGSGKSHFFAELGVESCLMRPGTRGVCIREVQKSLKESVKLLMEDKIEAFEAGKAFRSLTDHIVTPGNGLILFQGMQDHTAESIKSLEGFDWAYIEEGQTLTQRSLEMLRPTIRKEGSEIWVSWNPRHPTDPVDKLLRGQKLPPGAAVVRANYSDNPFFPVELEQERLFDKENNPDRYAHIWLGEYEPTAIGAIFTRQNIHENRRIEVPELTRIVVGVDPAAEGEEHNDQHGIVVAGIGEDNRGYVLEDLSCHGSPQKWATRAVAAFDKWEADAVVAEVNQGGEMVRHTLHTVRPNLPVIKVRAARGKHIRAEPIASLYTLNRVSHVGSFETLENQLCQFTNSGYEGEDSPDVAEAAIWALTELFPKLTRQKPDLKTLDPMSGMSRGPGSAGWMST